MSNKSAMGKWSKSTAPRGRIEKKRWPTRPQINGLMQVATKGKVKLTKEQGKTYAQLVAGCGTGTQMERSQTLVISQGLDLGGHQWSTGTMTLGGTQHAIAVPFESEEQLTEFLSDTAAGPAPMTVMNFLKSVEVWKKEGSNGWATEEDVTRDVVVLGDSATVASEGDVAEPTEGVPLAAGLGMEVTPQNQGVGRGKQSLKEKRESLAKRRKELEFEREDFKLQQEEAELEKAGDS